MQSLVLVLVWPWYLCLSNGGPVSRDFYRKLAGDHWMVGLTYPGSLPLPASLSPTLFYLMIGRSVVLDV